MVGAGIACQPSQSISFARDSVQTAKTPIFLISKIRGITTFEPMSFIYPRRIRFADTDAAGVVYFANYLSICHEAYEESLLQAGVELKRFFSEAGIMIPIAHSSADYLRPLACGDLIEVELEAEITPDSGFTLTYKLHNVGPARKLAARIRTDHVCIDSTTRRRTAFPSLIADWISSSGPRPVEL